MSDWTKADGAKIQITFSEPLIGDVSGNQAAFTVTVPEYDMVPGGTLQNVTKAVKSTYPFSRHSQTIDLSGGEKTDTEFTFGVLRLAVAQ